MCTRHDPIPDDEWANHVAREYEEQLRDEDEAAELTDEKIELLEELGHAFDHWIKHEGGLDEMFHYFKDQQDASVDLTEPQRQQQGT